VARVRAADAPSLPSPLSLERRVNPFFALRRTPPCAPPPKRTPAGLCRGLDEVFGVLRAWKDQFR
jgi:hypothetical protein